MGLCAVQGCAAALLGPFWDGKSAAWRPSFSALAPGPAQSDMVCVYCGRSAMYTQGLNVKDTGKPVAPEDPGKLARFQAKIDAEDKIEPNDWMPESYRRTLVRQISQHAHS